MTEGAAGAGVSSSARVAIVGAGAWGTALALALVRRRLRVALCCRSPETARMLASTRQNPKLPGFGLPNEIAIECDLGRALASTEAVFLATPSQHLRQELRRARSALPSQAALVSASKGIEQGSLQLMSQVVREELGDSVRERLAVLSGPSFALEVAQGLPTNLVCASENAELPPRVRALLSSERLRIYSSADVIGVEVGGALKNVIAIAVGASDALGFGYNARAGLITRGLAEIARLASALGGDSRTVSGLSGLGDLVLTAMGDLSRNRTLGYRLGQGLPLEQVLRELGHVAEGVSSADCAARLGQRCGVDLPITNAVQQVLCGAKQPREAMRDLLDRSAKSEWES